MYLFQVFSFIFEILFVLCFGVFVALCPKIFVMDTSKKRELKYIDYSFANKTLNKKSKNLSRIKNLGKITWFLIVMTITIYFIKPYFFDIPPLIKGNLNYTIGTVYSVKREYKDPFEYVYISGVEKVKFFFSSGVKENKEYKIGYLPNTLRAIYCAETVDDQVTDKKDVGFPFKEILSFMGLLGMIFIIPLVEWKLFIIACILFYPSYIYLYIKHGIKYGTWFSSQNEPLMYLSVCFISLIVLAVLYLIEQYRSEDVYGTMIFAQMIAIIKIAMFISIFFHT